MTDKQVATRTQSAPAMIPNVDVVEDDAGITISADLPGVPKDKLLLRIEGESLQIEGELRSREYQDKKNGNAKRRVWEVRVDSLLKLDRAEKASAEDAAAVPAPEEVPF